MSDIGFRCPYCKGKKLMRKGFMPALGGKKQRYVCWDCGHTFYAPEKGKRRKSRRA